MKVNPFREFLNIGANIFDMAEVNSKGEIDTWKSKELLDLMEMFYKWNQEYGEPIVLKEDEYDVLKATNPAIQKLVEAFGLQVE